VTARLWELNAREDGHWLGTSQNWRAARRQRRWLALDLNVPLRQIRIHRAPKQAA